MARPRLLLLDFDGVLAHYDRGRRVGAIAVHAGAEPAQVHQAMFGEQGLEHACDRGEFDLPDSLARLRARHGWTIDEGAFIAARSVATRVDPAMAELVGALAGGVELAVFTNNGAWFGEHIAAICPPLRHLAGPRFVCAGSLGHAKPEAAAYALCLRRLGWQATDTLFVDDNAANVEGARAAGLHALHFTGATGLRSHLIELGFSLGEHHAS